MRVSLVILCLSLVGAPSAHGSSPNSSRERLPALAVNPSTNDVDRALSIVSGSKDPAAAKLAMDKLIDPSIDEAQALRQLDDLALKISRRIPSGAGPDEKLRVLLTSLSTPGVWNDHRAFRYDLSDPMGRRLENKLLSTYLRTRQGNCVSMPILVLALGQRMGLDMTLAVAPEHVLVKFRSGSTWHNVEATSSGLKSDESYRSDTGISDLAMKNGIYLRPLSARESVAVLGEVVLEHYRNSGDQEARLLVADKLLSYDPKNVQIMLHKGNAYFRMMKEEFFDRGYTTAAPRHLALRYRHLQSENIRWFERAEALGWREPSAEDNQRYLDSVNLKKSSVRKEQQQ